MLHGTHDGTAALALLGLIVALGLSARMAHGGDRISSRAFATRSEVIAEHGMAATSHPLATQIALDVLKSGGSAVDAAIAANAALGLMEPTGSGIGGDLFAIVWDAKTQKLHGLNASGRSPIGLTRQHLLDQGLKQIPPLGPLPVSVPGCVDGWFELHAKFGRKPMAELLAPAIRYAREGFPVTELIAYYWARSERLAEYPGFRETFLPGGQAPRKGELFRNPGLADTLTLIGEKGRDAFYAGPLTETMDTFFRRVGCFLRRRDFQKHTSTWVEPVSVSYRGYDVWELPPNGQGIAALQMLNMLEGYDLAKLGHNSADTLHLMLEAKKLAFEDRARFYADPDFAVVPVPWLISKEYGAEQRARIDLARAALQQPAGQPPGAGDTIYLCVADAERNMVSLIQSNYRGFGSGLCPDGLGFCLQDRGEMFSLVEGHPNVYEPHKRPFHTIIPGFLTRAGKPLMAFGVMGGDMQPQGHVQVLCNIIDFGMNVQEAGDAARWYHTGSSEPTDEAPGAAAAAAGPEAGAGVSASQPAPASGATRAAARRSGPMTDGGVVALESGVSADARAELARRGHRLEDMTGPFGGYQAIWYDAVNDVYIGASESRKDGQAAGF